MIAALTVVLALLSGCKPPDTGKLVIQDNSLYLVTKNGEQKLISTDVNVRLKAHGFNQGSTLPRLSPDGKRAAFLAKDGSINIVNLNGSGAISVGSPVEVDGDFTFHNWITAWSPDSSRLLYSWTYFQKLNSIQKPDSVLKKHPDLIFHVYDLEKRQDIKLPNLLNFDKWTPDSSAVIGRVSGSTSSLIGAITKPVLVYPKDKK